MDWAPKEICFNLQPKQNTFLFPNTSKLALQSTQPPIQWSSGPFAKSKVVRT